jgi:ATP-dependent helicase/nuclease subunit B
MLSAVSELKAYCITPTKLASAAKSLEKNETLRNKLVDLELIMSAYSNHLYENYSDTADDLSRLAKILSENDFFSGADVYIDSFTSFTMQEYEVIKQILRSADNLCIALTLDKLSTAHIHYESTADTSVRIQSMARRLSADISEEYVSGKSTKSDALGVITSSLWDPEISDCKANDSSDSIRIIQANDPYDEAEAAANIALNLITNGARCKDIAIIARDASQYRGIIDVILDKIGVPYFFSQSTDVMSKPTVKFLFSALRIKIYNRRREDVIAYLKSGLGGFEPRSIDMFEKYTSTWNIRGSAFSLDDWTMNPDGYSERLTENGKMILSTVNSLKADFLPPLERLFVRLDSADSAMDMCRAVYLFMEENHLREIISREAEKEFVAGHKKESAESLQIFNAIIKSLEDVALILGSEDISVKEFYDSFKIILSNATVNTIPTAEDQITIGSASLLRTGNIKHAILLGLNEGEFPQNVKETGIFSDNDKKVLEELGLTLSGNSSLRASDELFYVYRAMSAPSEKLYLLYHSSSTSGEQTMPSMAIERILKLFPSLRIEQYSDFDDEEIMISPHIAIEKISRAKSSAYALAVREYFKDLSKFEDGANRTSLPASNKNCSILPETAQSIYGQSMDLTQSKIDLYVECPFEYLCKQLLSLKETAVASFDYNNFGSYIHYIFESYLRKATEDGKIGSEPDIEYIHSTVNQAADVYFGMAFSGGEANSARLHHRFARMRRLAELVAINITREFAESNFRPEFFELSIGKNKDGLSLAPLILQRNDGGILTLSGKIDRVDVLRSERGIYVRVVDYKSGRKIFNPSDLDKGLNVQLPLYLFSLCHPEQKAFRNLLNCTKEDNIIPAGAMYLSSLIQPVEIGGDDSSGENDVLQKAESSISRLGFLINDEQILTEMSSSLSKQYLCGISKSKKGILNGSALISEPEMHKMNERLQDKVKEIADNMLRGRMSPEPALIDKAYRCKYCAMRAVCRSAVKSDK